MKHILVTMEKLGFIRNEEKMAELRAMSTQQLMKDFVLPQCLCLPRSGNRYPRISGSFMRLMTAHGLDFLNADYELGSVLLECAMQRITKHPDLPAIDYRGNLPEEFKPYAASSVNPNGYNGCPDEPGLWGSAEVHFLLEMLPVCLELRNPVYAAHAKLILFQIVRKLNLERYSSFAWISDKRHCDLSEEEVWKPALDMLFAYNLVQEFVDYSVANNWRADLRVYKSPRFYGQDEMYLLNKIDLNDEVYYCGGVRFFLKVCGLYKKMTRRCILKEIRG